jgi:hypothetical protein
VQRIQLKKFPILKVRFEIIILAVQRVGDLKLRLGFEVAIRILFEELCIIFACLCVTFLTELLVAKPEIVFRSLGFFLCRTATKAKATHAE